MRLPANDTPMHSPRSDGRKRRLFGWTFAGVATAALVGVILLANSSLSLNLDNARHGIEQRLAALTGRSVQVDGGATFRLLPRPVVELSNLRMDSAQDPRELRVARVIAQLDLLDALFGRTDISRLTLVRPEFTEGEDRPAPSTPDAEPAPADGGADATQQADLRAVDLATHALRTVLQRFEGVRYIEVRDGLFRPQGDAAGVSNINLALEWDGRRQPAELSGSFVWNGQPADVMLTVSSPAAFLAGDESQLSATLRAPPVSLRFDGSGTGGTPFQLDGRLSLEAPSLARLSRWIGSQGLALPDFGSLTLETDMRLAGERAFLNRTSVVLDDMRAQGALEIAMLADGRPMLGGTLAFESFDFDTLGGAIAPVPRNILDLQRRIPLHFVRNIDLDLRLSATQSLLAGVTMNDLAATVKFAGGNAVVDIGDVSLFGGRAQGRVSLDANAAAPHLVGNYTLQGVDAAALAQRLSAEDMRLTGTATIVGQLDLPVRNWAEIANGNRVEARVEIASGTVAGLPSPSDLQQGRRSFALQPGQQPARFDRLAARLSTAGSFLSVESFEMAGSPGLLTLQGLVALADTSVSLEGLFEPAAADVAEAGRDATFTSSKPIEFILRGEWPSLDVTVTPRSKPI